jgi:hypothetical protein
MANTTRRFWFWAFAIVIGGSTLSTHAQLVDIYNKAGSLLRDAATQVPAAQAQCYLQLARANECLGGLLTGGASSCGSAPTNCSTVPGIGGGIGSLATSATSRVTNSAASTASRAQDIQQAVNVGMTVFKGIMAFRKQRQAQRERAALQQQQSAQSGSLQTQGADAQAEEEARRLQSMAEMLAHQRALLEEAADKLLADGKGLLDSADQLFGDADALLGRRPPSALLDGSGSPASSGNSARAESSGNATPGNSSQDSLSQNPSRSGSSTGSGASADGCARGWAEETFTVTQFGNDTLWENSGALAFITNESGQASAFGKFLSVQYATGHKTHLYFGLAGALNNDLAPGDSRRLAIDRSGVGAPSIDIRVRYCKE